jgi:carboxyl-terminal processing protease
MISQEFGLNKDNSVEVPKKFNYKRTFVNVVVLMAVFGLGLGVGTERINLGPDGIFRKSVQKSDSNNLDYTGVEELHNALKESYDGQLDSQSLEDGLKAGLVKSAGDPYTEFLNADASKEFNEQLNGSFEGIGAELGKENQSIIIISPIDGFPAQKAGIKARDIINKINDESAYDITITDAVKKIRGQKGTTVKLQIVRDGKPIDLEITREQINLPSVKTEITVENIGIIKISRFGEDTVKLVQDAAKDFKAKNVKGVILDMRGNPGGLLDASVAVSSIWLPKGKNILEEKRDGKVVNSFSASGNSILLGMPTVVLVDGGSASASEIVSGALRDNGVATIIGTKTFGKGSVQEIRQLQDGGVLKVTIARWFTPSGRNIDKEGIEPDQKVEITDADAEAKRDPQRDAAIAKLK